MYAKTTHNSLGQFKRSRERVFHFSRDAKMIANPAKAAAGLTNQPFFGPALIPWLEKGVTFRRGDTPRRAI